jgi:hypothetical protein
MTGSKPPAYRRTPRPLPPKAGRFTPLMPGLSELFCCRCFRPAAEALEIRDGNRGDRYPLCPGCAQVARSLVKRTPPP